MSPGRPTDRPPPSSEQVTRQMKRMGRKDTKPELLLRRELHALGLRYRVNLRGLPGTPDIVFTRAKIAVFVDGCFWHSCPEHGVLPKANREWWREKLDRNVVRDRLKDEELVPLGWLSIHVWEHEDFEEAASRIRGIWEKRIRSGVSPGRTDPSAVR